MYIQKNFQETRLTVLHSLIRACPLATFIVIQNGEIVVNHMPLVVSTDKGDCGVLSGHLPIENSIWQSFDDNTNAVAVFQGPSSYISPSWYPGKSQHGKVVPTWNYVVVHAHGRPAAIDDPVWLLRHLNEMTNKQEKTQSSPWKVSDAPKDYTENMLSRLVGLEMPITALQGKWKVSQNRSEADQLGVADGLRNQNDANSLAMEALMRDGGQFCD